MKVDSTSGCYDEILSHSFMLAQNLVTFPGQLSEACIHSG